MRRIYILALGMGLTTTAMAQQTYSLAQVKELAIEHNINIRTIDNSIEQAKEQKKEAYTKYFPQVSAMTMGFKSTRDLIRTSIGTTDLLTPLASLLPSSAISSIPTSIPVNLINKGVFAGITAIQPVYAGGQITNGNKLADLNIQVNELQRRTSANTVELTAEQYYWQILTLKEKKKTLAAVDKMLKKLEKDADIAVKAGVGMRNDLLQVQLKENEVESNQLKLDNGIRLSKMVLAQYIGLEGQDIDINAVDTLTLPSYPTVKVDHKSAVDHTPEYHLLQKNVEAKTLERKLEVGKNMPTVGVGASYEYDNFGSGLNNNFGAVFATVSIPISSWWGGSHAIKRKKLAEENAREQLADNRQLLKIRMQKNWNDVDDAYKQLLLAKKGIEQSEENLRLNTNFYHAGTVTMNDVLDAEQQYQQCRDRFVDAYSVYQTKLTEYRQSIGE